jgi:hypothetical protein
MIGRIRKLNLSPSRVGRYLVPGFGLAAIFGGTVASMLRALPGPHSRGDYLISGGVATMVSMLALLLTLVATGFRSAHPVYRRRRR